MHIFINTEIIEKRASQKPSGAIPLFINSLISLHKYTIIVHSSRDKRFTSTTLFQIKRLIKLSKII